MEWPPSGAGWRKTNRMGEKCSCCFDAFSVSAFISKQKTCSGLIAGAGFSTGWRMYILLCCFYISFSSCAFFPVDTTLPPIQDASYWQMLFSYLYTFWAKLFSGTSLCLFLLLFYLVSPFFFSLLFEALNIHYRSGSMRKIKKQLELSFRLIFCCF